MSNWRPIILLNVDYKITTKAISNRLKTVSPSIISSSQTGFINNRYKGENVRTILDRIEHRYEAWVWIRKSAILRYTKACEYIQKRQSRADPRGDWRPEYHKWTTLYTHYIIRTILLIHVRKGSIISRLPRGPLYILLFWICTLPYRYIS